VQRSPGLYAARVSEAREDPAAACPACGGERLTPFVGRGVDRLHSTAGEFRVLRCLACGTGATKPDAGPQDLAAFYPSDYGPYAEPGNVVLRLASAAIRRLQAWLAFRGMPLGPLAEAAPARAVDVGCGRGDLAAALVERGWSVTGVEPSPEACAVARERGVDARAGTLADVALEPGAYAGAVFHHSLEHVNDPVADLTRLAAALEPGGLVSITVPNFGSWQARRFRSRWFHLDLPRHRVHFTATGLRRALERAGFDVDYTRTSTSSVGLPGSLQYALAGRCLFPRGLPLRLASAAAVLVFPVAIALDRLSGAGDVLHALARRPR
jgi:SAM-dependent methyltransferase